MSDSSKRLLSVLLVLGAQSPEKALEVGDIALKLGTAVPSVEEELAQMVRAGYAMTITTSGTKRAYLTGTGIITASSTYS